MSLPWPTRCRPWSTSSRFRTAIPPAQWFRGWAEARNGRPQEGHRLIREAYDHNTRLGMRAGASEVLGYAAEALLLAGDVEGAQAQLQEALQIADELGEGVYLPQLLLLQAAIARAQRRPEAGTASVRRAVEEARKQQAPWLELLALVDLCAHRERLDGGAPGPRRAGGPAARSGGHRAGDARTFAAAAREARLTARPAPSQPAASRARCSHSSPQRLSTTGPTARPAKPEHAEAADATHQHPDEGQPHAAAGHHRPHQLVAAEQHRAAQHQRQQRRRGCALQRRARSAIAATAA